MALFRSVTQNQILMTLLLVSLGCCVDILQYSGISVSLYLSIFNHHIFVVWWTFADLTAQHPFPFFLVRTTVFSFGKLPLPH